LETLLAVAEPVGAPDAVKLPAEAAQDGLAQPVAVARPPGIMVVGAVALDAEKITAGRRRVDDRKVDPVPAASDLGFDLVPGALERGHHLVLELLIHHPLRLLRRRLEPPGLREGEERLERFDARAARALEVEVVRREVG